MTEMPLLYLRSAIRSLRRTPVLSLAAIASLALGIGANAAIFSAFNQSLLQRLPVSKPEELVTLSAPGEKRGRVSSSNSGGPEAVFSYPLFRDLERGQQVFAGLAAHRDVPANVAHRGRTSNERALLVSGSYFPVLGLQPALGRLLAPADDQTAGAHRVAVLSHAYWRSRFGEDPSILNDTLMINGEPMTVVGVAPRGFHGTTREDSPDVFVPLMMSAAIHSDYDALESRRDHWLYLFGRLKPGIARAAAESSMHAVFRGIMHNIESPQFSGTAQARERYVSRRLLLADGARGEQPNRGEMIPVFVLLFSSTGIVVLIACANIANLLLARGVSRAGEFAVRLSLGARRGQIVTQLLTESLLLAVLGGLAGLFVGRALQEVLRGLLPGVAETQGFGVDAPVLVFGLGLSLVTALIFGMLPAFHSTRVRVATLARAQAGLTSAGGGGALRSALVASQIALALALLVVAGLFTRSLVNVGRVDLGMQISNLTTFRISPVLNGYTAERSQALFEQLDDQLSAVPGVRSVTQSTIPLLEGSDASANLTVQGFAAGPDTDTDASTSSIGSRFFSTLGIPLIAGREFTRADSSVSQHVAVVNESFARKFNLGPNAIGTRMELGRNDKPKFDIEIVGLVRDAKYSEVKDEIPPQFFLPHRQRDTRGAMNYYVRSSLDSSLINPAISRIVGALDSNLPIENLRSMEDQVRERSRTDALLARVSTGFAALATLLAAVGLYGVLAYSVAQRTPEIGVRLALGADAARIRGMVLGHVGRLTLVGVGVGLAGAVVLGRLAASMLFRVDGIDPVVMSAAVAAVVAVALAAATIPAFRASRIDPAAALRAE
ncbi:MAG: ABC transporter permease [Acidobacteria bacterium]|nr:MAG: ABC transporter permease [Acidobacteriota bacterium]